MHKTLFVSLFALTLFLGCTKKKKNTSPYSSSEYFTCLVNGEEWEASTPNNPNGPPAIEAHYYPEYDQLHIAATQKDQNFEPSIYQTIFLHILHPSAQNPIMKLGTGNIAGFNNYLPSSCGIYYFDSLYFCICHIDSFDLSNHKVKGSFTINLRNGQCSDSIMTISNGHFSTYFQ